MVLADIEFSRRQYATDANLRVRSSFHAHYSVNQQGWFNWVWEQLPLAGGQRLLEVGCGDGSLWRGRLDRLPAGCTVVLTDYSTGMLSSALASLGPGAPALAAADAQALPLDGGSCDLVIANHVLYHVPDRARALTEIARVLKPGGWLCATTVGEGHMRELHALLRAASPVSLTPDELHLPSFTLQSGALELKAVLQDVQVREYVDELRVPDVAPVLAYMRSMWSELMGSEATALIEERLARELAERGEIRIHKESGMLLARRK